MCKTKHTSLKPCLVRTKQRACIADDRVIGHAAQYKNWFSKEKFTYVSIYACLHGIKECILSDARGVSEELYKGLAINYNTHWSQIYSFITRPTLYSRVHVQLYTVESEYERKYSSVSTISFRILFWKMFLTSWLLIIPVSLQQKFSTAYKKVYLADIELWRSHGWRRDTIESCSEIKREKWILNHLLEGKGSGNHAFLTSKWLWDQLQAETLELGMLW